MRLSRFKVLPNEPVAYYHVAGHSVDPRFVFADEEKDYFLGVLRTCETFCSVRVLTYSLVPGRFHLLVEVPQHPGTLGDEDLKRRLDGLFCGPFRKVLEERWKRMPVEQALRDFRSYANRFWDLSWFVRFLKQRFAQWYNSRTKRRGTLWEGRFDSAIVEGTPEVLSVVGAYIDLACVRAGLVSDPAEYRWCGIGEAIAGVSVAVEGIRTLMSGARGPKADARAAVQAYNQVLYGEDRGRATAGLAELTPQRIANVLAGRSRLSLQQYLRCHVRYFEDGTVIGSRAFVDRVFTDHRWRFGPRRKDGARRMRWVDDVELYSARQLVVNVLQAPTPLSARTP